MGDILFCHSGEGRNPVSLSHCAELIPIPKRIWIDTLNVKEYTSGTRARTKLTKISRIYLVHENLYFKI